MKTEHVHNEALLSAKVFLEGERKLLGALIEVDKEKAFQYFECTHLTPYCVKILKLSEDVAACLVRVVRRSQLIPDLAAAVTSGRISLYKARAICSVIQPENSAEWIEKAARLSKKNLENEVSEFRGIKSKRLTLNLPLETIALLQRARDVLSTKIAKYASIEDLIHHMTEDFLYRHDPVEKAARSKNPSAKHEVNLRDQGRCQVVYKDGTQCEEEKWVHQHHIIHQKDGGPDTVENLVTMCATHHRMLHKKESRDQSRL